MALQAYKGGMWFPERNIGGAQGNITMDASGERVAMRFLAPKSGDILKIHFRVGTVTSSQSLTPSMQDEDLTTGLPDGTADQSAAAIGSPSASAWNTADFTGVARTVTINDIVWFVVDWTSTAGNLQIARGQSNYDSDARCADNTGGSYATRAFCPIMIVEYSDGSFEPIDGVDFGVRATVNFNTSAGNQERGLKFKVPFSAKCNGIGWGFSGTFAGNGTWTLYDSDGTTVLGQQTVDKDSLQQSAGSALLPKVLFAAVTLTKDTYYFAVLQPTSASNVSLAYYDVNTAAHLDGSSGGQDFHWVERATAGSGAFTATTTRRGNIWVRLSSFDDGAGGGAAGETGGAYSVSGGGDWNVTVWQ